jgi:hypothetical protein
MKPTPFFSFATASCLIGLCMIQPSATAEPLPAWVVAEKEPLVMKKPAPPSYLEMTQTATIVRPKALTKVEELEKLNPGLTQALPGLRDLVSKGTVSPKFKRLYDAKIESMKGGVFMSDHSYFDCATVLNVRSEKSGRTAVVFQSDMETDTDGTDPVRLPLLKDYDDARLSRSFQPVLSYAWSKGADGVANPFISYYDDTIRQLRGLQKQVDGFAQADRGPVWQDMKKHFEEQISTLDRRANYYRGDLQRRRSLVGSLDPFIVVPTTWVGGEMSVGDFAVVVHAGHVYPCIIGDTGPKAKTGEASQRLAKALNPNASGKVSAVSSPCVTYIVFPQTRSAKGAPDLARYQTEIGLLIDEIGGLGGGVKLHAWQ